MKNAVWMINPMGYGTIGQYDSHLLNNLKIDNLVYVTNILSEFKSEQIRTLKLYTYADKSGFVKGMVYFFNQLLLVSFLFTQRPAKVHFQWFKSPIVDQYLIRVMKWLGIEVIYTAHNVLPHNSGVKYRKQYLKIYKLVDKIIVHAKATKNEIARDFDIKPSKIRVIPHGLIQMKIDDPEQIIRFESELLNNSQIKEKTVFTVTGGLTAYKGIDLVFEAWGKESIQNLSNITLLIAGRGNSELINPFKDLKNVVLLDHYLSNEEFIAVLRASDFVLLPYRRISQSGLLLTVLNERRRVVVSNVGGLTQPFEIENIGYILDDLNAEALASTIVKASHKKEEQISDEAWQRISDFYDWKHIALKTKTYYYDY